MGYEQENQVFCCITFRYIDGTKDCKIRISFATAGTSNFTDFASWTKAMLGCLFCSGIIHT